MNLQYRLLVGYPTVTVNTTHAFGSSLYIITVYLVVYIITVQQGVLKSFGGPHSGPLPI